MAMALALAACGGNSSDDRVGGPSTTEGAADLNKGFNQAQFEGTPQVGGSITFGLESKIATLDPASNLAQPADIDTAFAVYDPLIDFDDAGEYAPGLATEWEGTEDLETWTLHLREGVMFTDGTPFNADAVVKQFERFKDPATRCTCAPTVAVIESITAPDASTVVFQLSEPNAFFLSSLTGVIGLVVSPTATAKWGADYARHPVGTGPFMLEDFDSLVLKKNPDYWKKDDDGNQLPYLDEIDLEPITDSNIRLQSLKAGDIDAMQTADTANVADALEAGNLRVQKVTGSSATITIFNMRKPPFNDVRLRRAIAHALNRAQLNSVSYKGARQEAYSPFALDSPFYADVDWPKYDPAKAKALVAAAKADGVPVSFTTSCIATPEARSGLAVTRANGRAVGFRGEVEFLDQGAYVNKVIGANHEFTIGCFRSPQIANADGLYSVLHTGGSGNVMGYSNEIVDKALDDIRRTSDQAEHIRLLRIVQEQVAKDVPSLPLLYDLFANIYSPKLSGFPVPRPNFLGSIRFTTLYIRA